MIDTRVHTGYWVNWSKGGSTSGATITLPSHQGNFLVAFLALFVQYAGSHLWDIICLSLYQLRSSTKKHDGLYHQQQNALRNGVTSTNALFQLLLIAAAWRSNTRDPVRRSLGLISVPAMHIAAFGVAGVFSSRVVRTNDEVLIKNRLCGFPRDPYTLKPVANFTADDWVAQESFYQSVMRREDSRMGYTQTCYAEDKFPESSPCLALASPRLDSRVVKSAACPFAKEMCVDGLAFQLDTGYVNSNKQLGINGPPKDQIYFRIITTWAPLAAQNYTSSWLWPVNESLPGEAIKQYNFGPALMNGTVVTNYTVTYSNYSSMRFPYSYMLDFTEYYPLDPLQDLTISTFKPIPQLLRTDADVAILPLYKYTTYIEKVTDPWFSATTDINSRNLDRPRSSPRYAPDVPVSFLAVTTQMQFCHSSDFKTSCTPLQGQSQLGAALYNSSAYSYNFSAFNQVQTTTASFLWTCITYSSFIGAIAALGSNVLNAWKVNWGAGASVSGGLPATQWQIEAFNLHNLTLAGIQRIIVEWASPPVLTLRNGRTSVDYINPPRDPQQTALCGTIKIRNAAYSSFSVLGLVIIFTIGLLMILINMCLVDIVHAFAKRAWFPTVFSLEKNLSWIHAESLHLQRRILENRGVGPWKREDEAVPVTRDFGTKFYIDDEEDKQAIIKTTPSNDGLVEHEDEETHRNAPQQKYGYVSVPMHAV